MNPLIKFESDFNRLFRDIPKPDPLASLNITRVSMADGELKVERIDPSDFYMAPVDADEMNHGPCAQGDCDE